MQHTTCTEDRIQHALDRCLDGLRSSESLTQSWNTGWCMNRWSLEELLKRDPENFLILLQQVVRRAREAQQEAEYELVAPLVIMFESTLLQTPYCPLNGTLLAEACEVFHGFLTWPEPYCSVCRRLLATLQQELRAPGISYHRLVSEEQGLTLTGVSQHSRAITVLLMNPVDVPPAFLSVVERMGGVDVSQRDTTITLIKHAFQATLGTKYPLPSIHLALQAFGEEELSQALCFVTELMESAAATAEPATARARVAKGLEELREKLNIPACNSRNGEGMLQILRLPIAKCYTVRWETDSFDVLNELLEAEPELACLHTSECPGEDDEGDADEEQELDEMEEFVSNGYVDPRASMFSTVSSLSTASKDSMLSTLSVASCEGSPLSTISSSSQASGTDSDFCEEAEDESPVPPAAKSKSSAGLSRRLSRLFRPRGGQSLSRAKSLGTAEAKDFLPAARSKRSNSVPQQALVRSANGQPGEGALEHLGPGPGHYRRRPILSSDEGEVPPGAPLLRVLVFGADHMAGRVARAYSSLRRQERECPRLSGAFRFRFFFVPVRRDPVGGGATGHFSSSPLKVGQEGLSDQLEDSTNDIARLLGTLDPWYERNTHCLLDLPLQIVCRQTSRPELAEDSVEEALPILADLLLYYCRNATRPALLQLYQAELTLAGGETRTEFFIHSLELGHTAGTRAIKAMGAASKRFGIDGEREAMPLSLELVYNQVVISGRSQKTRAEKTCTSINLTKACRNPEELNPKMECLQLTVTEVLKRQNSKSKKSYNQQLSTTRVKVDKVQVHGSGSTTFAVCFDQDEKKILQSVTRCEVSVCYKPETSADWLRARTLSAQFQPLQPTFCSLLCLPIATFSGPQP
ncbi:phosphoinositide 3-kinase regulatory subunit 5 isoform X2 [Electrophorus electricus]|uniref:Phosphoinositide 3-kinase regulatory subunit 5 n=1 Tax=Electrophorus electricus TaxID=8005 RepID=A0A4W4H5G2_ELEEL|nr:phosphoinositide 3-kinase regulatory subunit 5 isoform X2 [Electrophorus electricus]